MIHPQYYKGASEEGQPYLAELGFINGWGQEMIEAIAQHYPELLQDSCLFTAVKYLWRLGNKGNATEDVKKAIAYLEYRVEYGQMPTSRATSNCIHNTIHKLKQDYGLSDKN